MIATKTAEQLLAEALAGIVQETSIRMVGPGSVTRAFARPAATQAARIYRALADADVNAVLATANGLHLDAVAGNFGLSRAMPVASSVASEDRNVRISAKAGSLAKFLPHPSDSGLGRVPAGTVFSSTAGISFTVDEDYDFPAASRDVFVGLLSSGTGLSQNVGAGSVSVHGLGPDVVVTNLLPITTGKDLETDDEFRFRISKYLTSSQGRNETAVRLAVFGAPGVVDMIMLPFSAGAGSFKIVVIPSGNKLPVETLRQIRDSVTRVVSAGTFFQIDPPRYLPISMDVRLIPVQGRTITATDRDLAQRAILRYIGNIKPAKTFVVNQLRAAVLGSSTSIQDLRIGSLVINKRPQVLLDYVLRPDEVFVPDEDFADPIMVV